MSEVSFPHPLRFIVACSYHKLANWNSIGEVCFYLDNLHVDTDHVMDVVLQEDRSLYYYTLMRNDV